MSSAITPRPNSKESVECFAVFLARVVGQFTDVKHDVVVNIAADNELDGIGDQKQCLLIYDLAILRLSVFLHLYGNRGKWVNGGGEGK